MKHILFLAPLLLLLVSFSTPRVNETDAQTYLKLYTTVSGTGDSRVENWMLANNGTRRIIATVEILSVHEDNQTIKEKKNVVVESKSSQLLGIRSSNGSVPNTVVVVSAVYTPVP